MARAWPAVLAISAAAACGSGGHSAAPAGRDAGAGSGMVAAAPPELTRLPLGATSPGGFAWRARAGQAAYREAVAAEHAGRWPEVVAACRRARAADPAHLEAAWLEAAALARQGAFEQVLEPLGVAAAGDWGKWGERSLELALFAAFRDTPPGRAWTAAAAGYRDDYAAALGRAVIVGARGDLFAYDPTTVRWLRVTRTFGAVRGAVAAEAARVVAYVAVRKTGSARATSVGVVDLTTGVAATELPVAAAKVSLRFRDVRGAVALEVADGKPGAWARLDWRRGVRGKADGKGALLSPTLVVAGDAARLSRAHGPEVTADWDEVGAASAIRIERSRRTVTAPGTTLFDGQTLVWSPDRTRLAVATVPADPCAADDREVVLIDVDTGRLRSIDRGGEPAQLAWLPGGELAVVRGGGLARFAGDGTPLPPVAADAPIWLWTHPGRPGCAAAPAVDVEPTPEAEPEPDPEPPLAGGSVPDAAPAKPPTRDAADTVLPAPDASR